jgi:hypothetical protein
MEKIKETIPSTPHTWITHEVKESSIGKDGFPEGEEDAVTFRLLL